jgi:phage FluMu gp28-like protein
MMPALLNEPDPVSSVSALVVPPPLIVRLIDQRQLVQRDSALAAQRDAGVSDDQLRVVAGGIQIDRGRIADRGAVDGERAVVGNCQRRGCRRQGEIADVVSIPKRNRDGVGSALIDHRIVG